MVTANTPMAPSRGTRSGRGMVLATVAVLLFSVAWVADSYTAGKLDQWSNDLVQLVGTLSLDEVETPLDVTQGGVAGELGLPPGGRVQFEDDQVVVSIQRTFMWHTRCVTGRGQPGEVVEQVEVTEGNC